MKLYPSLISSDLLNLSVTIKNLDPICDGYHIDVMDDHFVPNLTWGSQFVSAIRRTTKLPLHLHLMVDNPVRWVNRVDLKKDDIFIFHHEVFDEKVLNVSSSIGVALNPATNVDEIKSYIHKMDHVLIMSVNPGSSGQKFILDVMCKVEQLIYLRSKMGLKFSIGMDGGIGVNNIAMLAKKGVEIVGVASAIFDSSNYIECIKNLYKAAKI